MSQDDRKNPTVKDGHVPLGSGTRDERDDGKAFNTVFFPLK